MYQKMLILLLVGSFLISPSCMRKSGCPANAQTSHTPSKKKKRKTTSGVLPPKAAKKVGLRSH